MPTQPPPSQPPIHSRPGPGLSAPARRAGFSAGGLLIAFFIAVLVTAANGLIWAGANRPIELPDWDNKIGGFAYSGFQRHQSPLDGTYPYDYELAADLYLLSRHTDRIRTYTSVEGSSVPALANEFGLRVAAGAWLDRRRDNNNAEIRALLQSVELYRNIDRVFVGNETILRGDLEVEELIRYLDLVQRRTQIPVSTAEPWHIWLKYPELARHVDFITVHLLPYWEGLPPAAGVEHVLRRYDELQRAFPRKKIVIGEVGWPSNGDRVEYARATTADQARFLREFLPIARERRLDYYLMEAFDQPWKQAGEGRTGAYWGMFDATRQPKFSLEGPMFADRAWPRKALAASLLAFIPILWFCHAFRRFQPTGLLFFGILIQASVTLVVWLVTVPFEFYLNTLDWVMMIVLLPALAAMLMILLANGFEFVEMVWHRKWLRHFAPRPLPPGAPEPFVSIHLPCHNEPPEMVIQTLASLARMDYRNFEVLVLDNNTRDEAVWKPVEQYVAALAREKGGERGESGPFFRFFHLEDWPGFKAGALNFGLKETDPRAAIVGVVDADYVVSQDWLKTTVAHFSEEKVAVVQCPQAHRGWQNNLFQRMCSWEYDGFFRIGMHHRNERDAIIQHGTMTLVRRQALESTGGWSEWCICEDAELGLRLMQNGWETRYLDAVLGRGLTPSNFSGYKSQRFRWAFGAMQILKRRWGWLVHPGPLTGGQRFHFLTGWFSWFADALHMLFTFGALFWTIGMIAAPEHFSLPLTLFLVPILGFFIIKAYFGPSLYRERVPCGWSDVIGASVASMALSHAIARGILAGLIQKQGTFVVTPKSWKSGGRVQWLGAVHEEALFLVAIGLGAFGTLQAMPGQYESKLWVAILATQAIPYLSALSCAVISAYAPRWAESRRARTQPGIDSGVHEAGAAEPLRIQA